MWPSAGFPARESEKGRKKTRARAKSARSVNGNVLRPATYANDVRHVRLWCRPNANWPGYVLWTMTRPIHRRTSLTCTRAPFHQIVQARTTRLHSRIFLTREIWFEIFFTRFSRHWFSFAIFTQLILPTCVFIPNLFKQRRLKSGKYVNFFTV